MPINRVVQTKVTAVTTGIDKLISELNITFLNLLCIKYKWTVAQVLYVFSLSKKEKRALVY